MNFYKTTTGTYLGLNVENLFQVTFGKREDGTFYFSQETFPIEALPEIEEIYANSDLTPVNWADSNVPEADIVNALLQNLQLGNLIN